MKWQAVIVLLAIALSIAVPPSFPMSVMGGGEAQLGILDLCHAGTPSIVSNGDMPCANECPCRLLPPAHCSGPSILATSCKPLFIEYQIERPPKA